MKKKNVELEFCVFNLTFNDKIYRCNILQSQDLIDKIYKEVKAGRIKTFVELRKQVRSYFMKYWSRCEFEYIVSGLFENDENVMKAHNRTEFNGYKLDVFYQIEKNLNIITEHIIHRMELPIEIPNKFPDDTDFWEKAIKRED